MADRKQVAAGSALTGAGLAASVAPHVPGQVINRAALGRAQRRLAKVPNPKQGYSAGHGGPVRDTRGVIVGHGPSAREHAQRRWSAEHAAYQHALGNPPVRGKVGTALRLGTAAAGIGGVWTGTGMIGRGLEHGRREVAKAFASEDILFPTSQDLIGIPRSRAMPVDPLQMKASSSIMAGILTGASGRHLTRRQKRRVRAGAFQFVGAQHMVVAPTGMKGLVTA